MSRAHIGLGDNPADRVVEFEGQTTAVPVAACLRVVPTDLHATIAPVGHVMDLILPRGNVTLFGGHGGAGKSLAASILCAHVACGVIWADLPVTRGKSLFVTLEDQPDVLRMRLRKIAAEYRLDIETVERGITIVDGSDGATLAAEISDCGIKRLIMTAAYHELVELAKGYDLIVVDNASDAFDADENNRRMVRAFIRALTKIARDNDAALLLLAHIDKNAARFGSSGNSYSGSTAWHNSARSRLALVDSDGGIELRHEKANLGPRIDHAIPMTWTPEGVLVPESKEGAASGTFDDDAAVLAAIRAAIDSGIDVPTSRTGPANTLRVLTTFPDLPKALRTKAGRDRFWDSISRLQRVGLIERESYTNASRHQRERWISARHNTPHPVRGTGETGAAGSAGCVDSRELAKPAKLAQPWEGDL